MTRSRAKCIATLFNSGRIPAHFSAGAKFSGGFRHPRRRPTDGGRNRALRKLNRSRWHHNRHTLVTELAESGAGDEVIMSIAGHVSRAMLSRYSHVRMEAKRRALDEIAARQKAADEKRKNEEEQQHAVVAVEAVAI